MLPPLLLTDYWLLDKYQVIYPLMRRYFSMGHVPECYKRLGQDIWTYLKLSSSAS